MILTYQELAAINKMMSIALLSGQVDLDEISESVHKKITEEILKQNSSIQCTITE